MQKVSMDNAKWQYIKSYLRLEKQIEEQHVIIDMLDHDLVQVWLAIVYVIFEI